MQSKRLLEKRNGEEKCAPLFAKLQTLVNIETDEARKKIDESFRSALNLPDISLLREMLSREPIIRLTSEEGLNLSKD
ncbi:hypothetical protein E6H31_00460 [Candidatus Bathyarchaeota archaeon]|nr:MAG: hypothetical protein E6H31_00460 [Candidatus Bathyarchaeota archaeon]